MSDDAVKVQEGYPPLCSECGGNSSPLEANPILCGGMICPVCNNLCSHCDGTGLEP